jgi:hypothetical protein
MIPNPQNSIEELKYMCELTIQNQVQLAKHKQKLQLKSWIYFVIYPRLGIILLIVMVK